MIRLTLVTLRVLAIATWLVAVVGAGVSHAQTIVNPSEVLGPATSSARAPAVDYRSPFDAGTWSNQRAIESWADANDEARKVGGHAGQLRDGGTAAPSGYGHAGHTSPASGTK
ncbi:MAG: hypothetical protein JNK11_08950 [Alphaproteobacteria bacterium]|nr:hypothetical protein [Alphaproteobacteria bacterium]